MAMSGTCYEMLEHLRKTEKFTKLVDFIEYVSKQNIGVLKRIDLNPASPDASFLMEFATFNIVNPGINRFVEFLTVTSEFKLSASDTGTILMSITVKDVWEAKHE